MTTLSRSRAVFGMILLAGVFAPRVVAQGPGYPPARTPMDAGEPPPVPGEDGMTVQPRGPVHEAFAQPSFSVPQSGPVVTRKPPAPVPEMPPEQRPEGDNVQWIPGYWAWDGEREDYLWVSGLWRVPPPGRKWVPGAWNAVEGGYQWTPGVWAPAGQGDFQYLPPPPDSLDNGPNGPPPDDDSFYTPGNWIYQSSRYMWQPGFWQAYRPGLIWMPAYYCWTPGGYLFVPGYWDWPLNGRGLLFAPVCFNRPLWTTPGWFYRPSYCINYPGLFASLFMGPGGGYYFGNYYGPTYRRLGYRPWFSAVGGYANPLYGWYRWRNLNNPGWATSLVAAYRGRYNGSLPVPPLTLNQQTTILNKTVNVQNNVFNSLHMVQPLSRYDGVRLARLSAAQVNAFHTQAQRLQPLSVHRLPPAAPALPHVAASHAALSAVPPHIPSARPIAPGHGEPRIITGHHPTAGPTIVHPTPHAAPIGHAPAPASVIHHNPAPQFHHTPPAPAHHMPAPVHHAAAPAPVHHFPAPASIAHHNPAPLIHHAPPAPAHHMPAPVHHAAPPAHHAAAPNHGGGGHHR